MLWEVEFVKCACLFCPEKRFSLNESVGLLGEESIIYQDDNVFVTPDISPLVIGHLLIVSKKHINSFASGNDAILESLEVTKKYLAETVFKERTFAFFEHGAIIENSAGSSIDHAHIHSIPLDKDINIDQYIASCEYITSSKVAYSHDILKYYKASQQSYIYYQICHEQGWVYPVDYLPHQFFRRMMANFVQVEYNWKINYKTEQSKNSFNMTLNRTKQVLHSSLAVNGK